MAVLLWFTIGFIVGLIITNIIWRVKSRSGFLRIDRSNPDKEIWRLDMMSHDPHAVYKKKRLILKIDKNANLSQE